MCTSCTGERLPIRDTYYFLLRIVSYFSKVLILRHTSSISHIPTTGQDYTDGDSISGSTVVYNSNATAFIDTRAKASTHYYYKLFAYDASFNYASGVEISGGDSKADYDGDGLIEIYTAGMLNNTHHNLAGASYKTRGNAVGNANGCPASGCNGYELTANIDLLNLLDTNENQKIDTTTVSVVSKTHTVIDTSKDTSWVPIGDNSTGDDRSHFTGTFEGNNHTIANLWVSLSGRTINAGLFGVTDGMAIIRNVHVISGSIHSSGSPSSQSYSAGLVGWSTASLTITNCHFSGSGGVSSSGGSRSGGLVGLLHSTASLTISNSSFSGSGGLSANVVSSGLVGSFSHNVTITNSYFSGSSEFSGVASAGGLVGSFSHNVTITNSYFSGSSEFSGVASSGGLMGVFSGSSLMITNSYWNTDATQIAGGTNQSPKRAQGSSSTNPPNAVGLTLVQLQAMSGISGMYPDGLLSPTSGIGDA